MRVVIMGSRLPDFRTLQRLLLIADQVGFVDRPSVMFGEPGTEGQWGTIGRASEIRQFRVEDDAPVTLSAHEPPSGPAQALYEPYVKADLQNPRFLEAVFNGLRDDDFAWRFIQPQAQHGEGRVLGTELRQDLLTDATLPSQDLTDRSVKPMFTGKFGSKEHRRALFKNVAIEASITITSTLAITAETGLQPVTEEPRFAQLLGMPAADHAYVGESPPHSGPLAIAVANALVPDETLSHLTVGDIFDYRRRTKEAYAAWSAEIDRLAVKIADMDPTSVNRVLPQIIQASSSRASLSTAMNSSLFATRCSANSSRRSRLGTYPRYLSPTWPGLAFQVLSRCSPGLSLRRYPQSWTITSLAARCNARTPRRTW